MTTCTCGHESASHWDQYANAYGPCMAKVSRCRGMCPCNSYTPAEADREEQAPYTTERKRFRGRVNSGTI